MDDEKLSVIVDEAIVSLDNNPQVQEKVRVKRNRGLKKDIKILLEGNPNALPVEVMASLQCISYGGSKPVSLNCVMATMYQLKK